MATTIHIAPPEAMLAALREGGPENVARWNEWLASERAKPEYAGHPVGALIQELDIHGSDSAPLDLARIDFSYAKTDIAGWFNFTHVTLRGANFDHAEVAGYMGWVDASDASFQDAFLHNFGSDDSHFDRGNFSRAQFGDRGFDVAMFNASFNGAVFDETTLWLDGPDRLSFKDAQFRNSQFIWGNSLDRSDFTGARFENVSFHDAIAGAGWIKRSNFHDAFFDDRVVFPHRAYIDQATWDSSDSLRESHERLNRPIETGEHVPSFDDPAFAEPPALQPLHLWRSLLAENEGVFIGESHSKLNAREYMAAQMPALAEMQVGVMFFEGFRPERTQALFDSFNAGEPGADAQMLLYLDEIMIIYHPSGNETMLALMRSAREQGILLQPIEDETSLDKASYDRLRDSNPVWAEQIEAHLQRLLAQGLITEETRYAIYGGGAHSQSTTQQKGVDAILGIPSVDLFTGSDSAVWGRGAPLPRDESTDADFVVSLPVSPYQATAKPITPDELVSQHRLNALITWLNDTNDGGPTIPEGTMDFSPELAAAIRGFEERSGLPVDGVADTEMQVRLHALAAETYLHRMGRDGLPLPQGYISDARLYDYKEQVERYEASLEEVTAPRTQTIPGTNKNSPDIP